MTPTSTARTSAHCSSRSCTARWANSYLKDEAALAAFEAANPGRKIEVSRFKGLGEMDWQELGETTMNPATRTLLQVTVDEAAIADEIFSTLMGDDVDARRGFIQTNAKDVRFLDI